MATAVSSYLNRKTPGVYLTEVDAFGTSIVGVETAVPVFVGYTACAGDPKTGNPLYNTAVRIGSMTEYLTYFGGAAPRSYRVTPFDPPKPPAEGEKAVLRSPALIAAYMPDAADAVSTPTGFDLAATAPADQPNQFNLYWQMRLFYANGGGDCFVVSCGSYWTNQLPVTTPDPVPADWLAGTIGKGDTGTNEAGLLVGLKAAEYAVGATMIVVPEACQLATIDTASGEVTEAAGYSAVAIAMLEQASRLQDRVAILDLPGCLSASTMDQLCAAQTQFWTAIAPQVASASYGAAYAPAVRTAIVGPSDILFTSLADPDGDNGVLNNVLTTQAAALYAGAQLATLQAAIATAFPAKGQTANGRQYSGDGAAYPQPQGALGEWQLRLDNLLTNALPVYAQIQQQIATQMNVAPPSGAIAGVWSKSDVQRGVWNAPANIALAAVSAPLYVMTDAEQAGFNLPTNGLAIDVIRTQAGRGNVVWGARTLDGNSQDHRYIQVRRTLIYAEQSIKAALRAYVFAANDATTWSVVTASIANFLTGLWKSGGLMGAKPDEAFGVVCGLGVTMTPQDVLDGYMIVAVTLQMIHPAEFIELTFTQKMGS